MSSRDVYTSLANCFNKVHRYYEQGKCLKKQKPEFYMQLNTECRKKCDWCPFDEQCDICGGALEVIDGLCYHCNECGLWDDAHNDEWSKYI